MTREYAIEELKKIYRIEDEKIIDLCVKRLGLSHEDINNFLTEKPRYFYNYKTNYDLIKKIKYPVKILSKIGILPPSLYFKFFT